MIWGSYTMCRSLFLNPASLRECSVESGRQISEEANPWSLSATLGVPVPIDKEGRRERRGGGRKRRGPGDMEEGEALPGEASRWTWLMPGRKKPLKCLAPTQPPSAGACSAGLGVPRAGLAPTGSEPSCHPECSPPALPLIWLVCLRLGSLKAGVAPPSLPPSVASTCRHGPHTQKVPV